MNKLKIDNFKIFSLISSCFVFTYIIIRAINIPIVHDEAATFFYYIQSGNFIPYYAHWDANNHILNSALSFINYYLFGDSVFSIRLASVLSFPIFALYLYKISNNLSHNYWKYLLFITLIFTHNFIEYFAFSRGYAMSMAFMIAAIYYVFSYYKRHHLNAIIASLLFLILAVLSNLTLINSAILIVSILALNVFFNRDKFTSTDIIKKYLSIFSLGIIPIFLFAILLFEFKSHDLLYYGTHDGFWDLTVLSLIKLITDSQSVLLNGIVISLFSIITILLLFVIIKNKFKTLFNKVSLVFPILLFGNLIAVLLLDLIFKVNYPEDRTGLYFYPFFIASFVFLIDEIIKTHKFKTLQFSSLIFVLIPIHFFVNINTTHSSFWYSEAIPESFIIKVKENSKNQNHVATIGGSHIRVLCWAYYNFRNGGELNQVQISSFPEYFSDYIIADDIELENWQEYYNRIDYDSISQINLLQRKDNVTPTPIYNFSDKRETISSREYINIGNYKSDTTNIKALNVDFELKISSQVSPLNARIVLSVQESTGKTIQYDYISLNWKRKSWTMDGDKFRGSFMVNNSEKNFSNLKVYIWNKEHNRIEISGIVFSVSKI